jgi:dGTPase
LEGAQIARTVARALRANEDLTEAIVLAHDLGHTPFGHSGERVLDRLLRDHGGFEHNRQSLRIVDFLEIRSARYRGLNLTQETREGILKHGVSEGDYRHPAPWPEVARSASLEAQIANASDEIADHNHDIDDGLRSGLLNPADLSNLRIWGLAMAEAQAAGAGDARVVQRKAIRALIDLLVTDLVETTAERLARLQFVSSEQVRAAEEPIVAFSKETAELKQQLATFLREELYQHHRVVRMAAKAERILSELWQAYKEDERLLPPRVRGDAHGEPRARAVADYIAGMTDRFAMEEHSRLFDPRAHV